MLNPDSQIVYDILRSITNDDEVFKIIEAEEVVERLPKDKSFTKVQLSSIIRDLKDRDYIVVKYFTPDEYCLRTIKRFDEQGEISQTPTEKKEKAERVLYDAPKTAEKPMKKGLVFLMSFLGAFLASAIVATVAVLVLHFVK